MASNDRLNDRAIRAAKATGRPYKLADGRGMYLLVQPAGGKLWRLKFRFEGKERSLSLGAFPDVSLADARKARDAARTLIARGIDPVATRRDARDAAAEDRTRTFEAAAEAFYRAHAASWSATHQRDVRRILDRELLPAIGVKAMTVVTQRDCQRIIDSIIEREAFSFASDVRLYGKAIVRHFNRTHAGQILDPWANIVIPKGPAPVHHPALPRSEVGEFLRRVRSGPATPLVRTALLLLTHIALRSGELRGATWHEVSHDDRMMTIPAARMKAGRDHLVPLSDQVLVLLADLRRLGAELRGVPVDALQPDDLLLPHVFDFGRPISDNTLSHAVWRAGYKSKHTPHGGRALFSSWANEVGGFNPDAIEAQLAHVSASAVRRAYNRSVYLPERVQMMAAWSAWLEAQERATAGDNVIPLRVVTA